MLLYCIYSIYVFNVIDQYIPPNVQIKGGGG